MANQNYEEDRVCLYKGDQAHVFSKHEVKDALSDGWKDNPADAKAKKGPGRPAGSKNAPKDE